MALKSPMPFLYALYLFTRSDIKTIFLPIVRLRRCSYSHISILISLRYTDRFCVVFQPPRISQVLPERRPLDVAASPPVLRLQPVAISSRGRPEQAMATSPIRSHYLAHSSRPSMVSTAPLLFVFNSLRRAFRGDRFPHRRSPAQRTEARLTLVHAQCAERARVCCLRRGGDYDRPNWCVLPLV